MLHPTPIEKQNALRAAMTRAYHLDETLALEQLLKEVIFSDEMNQQIQEKARLLVNAVRQARVNQGGLDAFLYEYDLGSEEGIALMCLAEVLLRIPDKTTIDKVLRDKISTGNWVSHLWKSRSFLVNAASFGLMLTGKILGKPEDQSIKNGLQKFIERSSLPVIRKAVKHAMGILGEQFVMGETIEKAIKRAQVNEKKGYRYSYDMLGEAARTAKDAERYFQSYQKAIEKIAQASQNKGVIDGPGISIKLSALHPRYEFSKQEKVLAEVTPLLKALALQAKEANIGLTVDAEEADRLDLSLDIFEAVFCDPIFNGWEGLGLAVQSYQKRAPYVLDWLIDLSRRQHRRIMVRLIKGAYWDAEIKSAQVKGLKGYPVFTRKASTDVSFIACAKKMLNAPDVFYSQFATHNAYSVAAILEMIDAQQKITSIKPEFEFQCLHGMGQTLYDHIVGPANLNIPVRVYAPVGGHEDLLAYLVRRLLENGANTSFVNRILDPKIPIEEIAADPIAKVQSLQYKPHPHIPSPRDIYQGRLNSYGIDLSDFQELTMLDKQLAVECEKNWYAAPIINGEEILSENFEIRLDPSDKNREIGKASKASVEQLETALASANVAYEAWDLTPAEKRAECLERAAKLFEERMPQFMALAIREGGKTINDAQAEVREAIDYCRYYAERARVDLAHPLTLNGPTGETNQLQLRARGVIACISPWNFPLAIFIGQVTAGLAAGNAVIAKPADQTPLIAAAAVRLLHEAGIPKEVLQFVPGKGSVIGAKMIADLRVKGVVFTGSTETARGINQALSNREGAIIPLIAETGGQNAMIVDSSALPEQVVMDVVSSAFYSAGQRCSALRVLFLQEDVADKIIEMLKGAMAEIKMGNPALLETDVGPVIDLAAKKILEEHVERMQREAKFIYRVPLTPECENGTFFAPVAFEIENLNQLTREVFGPVLHIIRYAANDLDKVVESINNTGYGLTLGIQSRIESTINTIRQRARVGNTYVNRNIIGAVVGVQPFGGENLSGTGPKAGGPHYLTRLCVERAVCINTTAAGGNASLLCLGE
jgi:RHH-type proline utilization regulon transcriptional repressor/proline dehydrogenase/delta 1-pyrroline-5-carboxylate dehydrogenase